MLDVATATAKHQHTQNRARLQIRIVVLLFSILKPHTQLLQFIYAASYCVRGQLP